MQDGVELVDIAMFVCRRVDMQADIARLALDHRQQFVLPSREVCQMILDRPAAVGAGGGELPLAELPDGLIQPRSGAADVFQQVGSLLRHDVVAHEIPRLSSEYRLCRFSFCPWQSL